MPAAYAHYRFGKLLIPQLPFPVRQCIQRFRRMYDVGLQGPDIFFYHNPFLNTNSGKLGKQIHLQSGQEFFSRAWAAADTEAAKAYLYGVLAHYCLDAACHPFVNRVDSSGEISHRKLEAEFDRYLMAMDGIGQPHRHDVTRHIKLTRGECMTAAAFYPAAAGADVRQSVRFMAFSLRFLAGGSRQKREKLLYGLKPSLCEMFVPEEPVAACARMDSELLARFNRALKQYPRLLEQLEAWGKTGAPLGEEFLPTFG